MQDYNSKIQFPTNDDFANRITFAEFVESKSSGNPMIHYTAEVVSPATVDIGGEQVNIAGVETEQYLTVTTFDGNKEVDTEKTEANRKRIEKFYTDCGQDFSTFDPQNPDISWMKGKVILTAMGCNVEPQRKTPTPEQVAKKQPGDIMKNRITGKDMVYYKPRIIEVFGLAPAGSVGASVGATPKPF
jgi:hypothetical protein